HARPAAIDPALVEAFEAAFTTTRVLAFTYRDQQGRSTNRRAEPHGLLVRPPLWYVIAWDTRQGRSPALPRGPHQPPTAPRPPPPPPAKRTPHRRLPRRQTSNKPPSRQRAHRAVWPLSQVLEAESHGHSLIAETTRARR